MKSLSNILLAINLVVVPSFCFGAKVENVNQTQASNFGIFDPNNNNSGSGGTILTNSCSTTGSIKILSSCSNATFLITGENNNKGGNTNRIRVRILNASNAIKNSANNSMNVSFSLKPSSNDTDETFNLSGSKGESGSVVVTVYGRIEASAYQASGLYDKNSTGGSSMYTLVACDDSEKCDG